MDNTLINSKLTGGGKPRLEYIDAMRGFIIFGVVLIHILVYSRTSNYDYGTSHIMLILRACRVHTFYFISGYLGFKLWESVSIGDILKRIFTKFKYLFIPTVLISLVFCAYKNELFFTSQYGFTWSLFIMFTILYICSQIKNSLIFNISYILLVGLLALFYIYDSKVHILPSSSIISVVKNIFRFMPYFMLGNFAKKYSSDFHRLINQNGVITTILIFFISCFFILYNFTSGGFPGDGVLLGGSGIIITYTIFYKYQDSFTKDKWIGRQLQYVGRRTMDIYFLHYFFLVHMREVGDLFYEHPLGIYELVFFLIQAIIIVCLCLLVSKVLCLSSTIEKWLFARVKPII